MAISFGPTLADLKQGFKPVPGYPRTSSLSVKGGKVLAIADLLNTYCAPGVPSALQTISHLIFLEKLCCYYCFTDEETEAPIGSNLPKSGRGFKPR